MNAKGLVPINPPILAKNKTSAVKTVENRMRNRYLDIPTRNKQVEFASLLQSWNKGPCSAQVSVTGALDGVEYFDFVQGVPRRVEAETVAKEKISSRKGWGTALGTVVIGGSSDANGAFCRISSGRAA